MRFFRRGPSDEPEPQPDEEPRRRPRRRRSAGRGAEPPTSRRGAEPGDDLIGDEWRTVASPDDVVVPEPTELELDLAGEPNAILGQLAPPRPSSSRAAASPRSQWAWGADYSPEKADEARREREREQLEQGLEKSRTGFGARLRSAFGGGDGADWDEIEEILITGDVGAPLSMDVVERARKRRDLDAEAAVRAELARCSRRATRSTGSRGRRSRAARRSCSSSASTGPARPRRSASSPRASAPNGRRVVLAAADTFRAAAIDQLRIWAQRTDSEIVAHAPNADPGGGRVRRARRGHRPPRGHRHRRHRRPAPHEVEPDGGAGQGPPRHRQAAARRRASRRSSSSTRRPARTASPRPRRSTRRSG